MASAVHLLLNCIIFYYPATSRISDAQCFVAISASTLNAIKEAAAYPRLRDPGSPHAIDLTQMAADYISLMLRHYRGGSMRQGFKIAAVVPVYGDNVRVHQHGAFTKWLGEFAGVAAKGGHFIIDHLHVPTPLDLNSPPGPVLLYFLVAMPTGLRYTIDFPACCYCA